VTFNHTNIYVLRSRRPISQTNQSCNEIRLEIARPFTTLKSVQFDALLVAPVRMRDLVRTCQNHAGGLPEVWRATDVVTKTQPYRLEQMYSLTLNAARKAGVPEVPHCGPGATATAEGLGNWFPKSCSFLHISTYYVVVVVVVVVV